MFVIEPYLIFDGNCEEAFHFYRSVFGGEFDVIMRYKELPEHAEEVPENYREKIMHAALPVGEIYLMGSDAGPGTPDTVVGNNVYLVLSMNDEDEARRVYGELSEGGKVGMALQQTFYAELYAMLTDKFGINWMINYGMKK